MDGAIIKPNSLVGANSLVTRKSETREYHLSLGNPAKIVRELTEDEKKYLEFSAMHYKNIADSYIQNLK